MSNGTALDVRKCQPQVPSAETTRWTSDFPLAKRVHKEWRHGNAARACFALWWAELAIAVHPLADVEDAIIEVDVAPSEATHLA